MNFSSLLFPGRHDSDFLAGRDAKVLFVFMITKLRLEWRYGGVFLLLQQRSNHPQYMVITPKASTSLFCLFLGLHDANFWAGRDAKVLFASIFVSMIVFSVLFCFFSLVSYNSHHKSRAQSRETLPAPRR